MTIDFRNTNTLWASILVETLSKLGLTTAIVCPGSRSTPLTIAFAQHPHLDVIPILDERSASFFALGVAKRIKLPVALVCTSGTAGANFYPAIIEAKESQIPLIVITADRPPELRHCHAGQTIDQVKLYGNYPNWQIELALPSPKLELLRYLRQNTILAWERALFPNPGIVHLNMPFREPLSPIPQPEIENLESQFPTKEFFNTLLHPTAKGRIREATRSEVSSDLLVAVRFPPNTKRRHILDSTTHTPDLIQKFQSCDRGIIIGGLAQPEDPQQYCQAIAYLAKFFNFPVLAEALSPLRNYSQINPYLISTYDLILRNSQLAEKLTPDLVIQIGELPTSKELRNWLNNDRTERWIVDPSNENFDPLHTQTLHLRTSIEQLVLDISCDRYSDLEACEKPFLQRDYCQYWCELEKKTRQAIDLTLESTNTLHEGKVAWLLSQYLPEGTPIFIANSMSVRYVEFFWKPGDRRIVPYFSRGANGIDGNLSTALGIAHRYRSTVMLTGDLALLHDTNGFLSGKKFTGHLTIILINNNGGGIFENLSIAQFDPPFEEFFATPQNIDFAKLCATYDVEYKLIKNWKHLQQLLNPLIDREAYTETGHSSWRRRLDNQPLYNHGIRVLELPTDRKADTLWLQNTFPQLLQELGIRD